MARTAITYKGETFVVPVEWLEKIKADAYRSGREDFVDYIATLPASDKLVIVYGKNGMTSYRRKTLAEFLDEYEARLDNAKKRGNKT